MFIKCNSYNKRKYLKFTDFIKSHKNVYQSKIYKDFRLFGQVSLTGTLVRTVHVFSIDIGMEFGMKKCGMFIMKRGKVVHCEGIMLPNNEVMKKVEKEGYTYLGIVGLDKINEDEMKKKNNKGI